MPQPLEPFLNQPGHWLQAAWQQYARHRLPPNFPLKLEREVQTAFYAGATQALFLGEKTRWSPAVLGQLKAEIDVYLEALLREVQS